MINIPEASLIVRRNVAVDQERNHCSTGNTLTNVSFDQQRTGTVESIMERAEMTWKWCSTDLPIAHVITFTVGMYWT